jgi:peptide/nickel transport system permease protein
MVWKRRWFIISMLLGFALMSAPTPAGLTHEGQIVLAMSIMGFLAPTLINGMLAVTVMWWPWYARLIYNVTRSEAREGYVLAAETVAPTAISCSARSQLLAVDPHQDDARHRPSSDPRRCVSRLRRAAAHAGLGSMVADGAKYMPDAWWLTVFPAIAILLVVLGFNLVGDGLREAFETEV